MAANMAESDDVQSEDVQSEDVQSEDVPVAETSDDEGKSAGLPFPVVGVGASAGGLEAFTELVSNLATDSGLAILFVLHLEPHHKSYLAEVLARGSPLPIREAAQAMPVEANHIYVIRPNTEMALVDGHLTISPRSALGQHLPIDHMFRSLARIQKSAAVGVLLSGGGTDGVLGFRAIKSEGGITFVQDEKTAKHASMPLSAIADGNVDYILSPKEIAGQLLRLTRHPYTRVATAEVRPDTTEIINEIVGALRASTGVDFSHYKRTTIQRRIERRMALRNVENLPDYLALVRKEPGELHNLYRDFLICVTQFFRDPEAYEALKEKVFPALVHDRPPETPIRIWSAGCATGEEVYSLAICLLEFLGTLERRYTAKFLATDLNEPALEKARAGIYLDNIEADVSAERLRRFFVRSGGHYQISKSVRDLCIFSKHNLVTDPPFSRLDLISCRNVLIYMNSSLQRRVLPILHYALNPGGFLFLGSSESIGVASDLFEPVEPRHRVFSKKSMTTQALLNLGPFPLVEGVARHLRIDGSQMWSALDVQKEADRIVLTRFAPVGVVVDESATVVQFRGRTAPFLEPAPGMASLDMMRMLREGLLAEVRGAFHQARTENITVTRDGVRISDDGRVREIRLEVIPFKVPPSGARFFLLLFEDGAPTATAAQPPSAPQPAPAPSAQQVGQLQQELTAVREYLQSVIEEQESTNEELKSANEEILSANEELQSTNEELQTAKEEAQSANEELATVNEELRYRNTELNHLNNDLINLLAGVNIPIVMVSRDLRVRRFTPQATKVFNLIPTDVGRPISDLKTNLQVPDFAKLVAGVIDTLAPHESGIRDTQGGSYALRIRPYITTDNKIDGASIVLLEVDSIMKSLEQQPAADGFKENKDNRQTGKRNKSK